jgi:hypothetical protein
MGQGAMPQRSIGITEREVPKIPQDQHSPAYHIGRLLHPFFGSNNLWSCLGMTTPPTPSGERCEEGRTGETMNDTDVPEAEKVKAFRLYTTIVGSLDTIAGLGINPLFSAQLHGALWSEFQRRWWINDYYKWRKDQP